MVILSKNQFISNILSLYKTIKQKVKLIYDLSFLIHTFKKISNIAAILFKTYMKEGMQDGEA